MSHASNMTQSRTLALLCSLIAIGFCSLSFAETSAKFILPISASRALPQKNTPPVAPTRVIGYWYMGTMSGIDCNLRLRADGTMTTQTGGCFSREAPIDAHWRIMGNKIIWATTTNRQASSISALNKLFGRYLSIRQVGKNTVLVPQKNEPKKTYDYEYCFWKNLLGARGLALPKEASGVAPYNR